MFRNLSVLFVLYFSQSSFAIYGGQSLPDEFTNESVVVRIRPKQNSGNAVVCSAVIVGAQTLLTAAHCTEDLQPSDYLILTDPKNGYDTSFLISSIVRHPKYRLGFKANPKIQEVGADIAVIHLRHPILFSRAQAIMAGSSMAYPLSAILIANGETEKRNSSTNLSLDLRVESLVSFELPILTLRSVHDHSGPCRQDSGGGIFAWVDTRYLLIGIQSTKTSGGNCGDANSLGFAVPVEENLSWILKSAIL